MSDAQPETLVPSETTPAPESETYEPEPELELETAPEPEPELKSETAPEPEAASEPEPEPVPYQARYAMEPLDVVEASEIDATPWSIRRRLEALFWRWPAALKRQWPLLVVWLAVIAGLVLIYLQYWRRGSVVVGGAVGLAAVFRLLLPPERAGLLVVRSRTFDVIVTGLAGAAIMGLAMIVAPR